jgi:hypothetical protein
MQNSLFDTLAAPDSENAEFEQKPELSQWFTPEWAAALLVERYFPSLSGSDLVLEPSCGRGAFLKAIPDHVPVIGVEIDPELAQIARDTTGRKVITGDYNRVLLPEGITAIVGNPPFELDIFDKFLARSHRILPDLSKCGFLLPAYFYQTYGNVLKWSESWSMQVDLVPRGLFPGIKFPLSFCVFRKDRRRNMVGFALYAELADVRNLCKQAQDVLQSGRPHKSVWRALIEDTLQLLGGKATLDTIYEAIEPKRPTSTAFWREKVRQQLQLHFTRIRQGEYALAA